MVENKTDKHATMSEEELQELVASNDTGGRDPNIKIIGYLISAVALTWSLFQIWIASPIPYSLNFGIFNSTESRSIHLAFAVFLGFMAYPGTKRASEPLVTIPKILGALVVIAITAFIYVNLSGIQDDPLSANMWVVGLAILAIVSLLASIFLHSPADHVPWFDWMLALIASFSAAYLYIFYQDLSNRPGNPITQDIIVACIGVVLLLYATWRTLGPPLAILATIFLAYCFAGQNMPELLAWKGASFSLIADVQWLSTDGVFGIALGVSTGFVFLFVLFGALLDKAGAGNYFIKVAFALLGHYRGGPAKAAVISSAMTGLISGSSIANVVTTGTFTIPMMKRVGFSSEKAGAVEVASSVNGQIMPPVMGAAAFLMVEYVGLEYFEVVKHAFLPALISYIALVYIVHLEALKTDMQGLPRRGPVNPFMVIMMRFLVGVIGVCLLGFMVHFGLGWINAVAGDNTGWWVATIILGVYVGLAKLCAKYPELEIDDPNSPVVELPEVKPTVLSGLHYLLPVVVLIWCLMIGIEQRMSPGLSAFWATITMIFILLTQRPLFAFFRKEGNYTRMVKQGVCELVDGLISGARNMIGIGIATATAGIIVGAVALTGVGLVLADLVEIMSLGNIMLMLILTAVLSLILGMGLPTTANYIVVSSLLAPVIVTLGQQNGLIVPLIAVHLFVFYFGIMADVTPPVGLASFAAAAVSGGDPIKTGFVAFFYSLRTAVLPFLFIFNTDLLLIDVTWAQGIMIFIIATVAMLIFAAATQGWFFAKNRIWETVVLLLIAFTLFRPGFWMDRISPPNESVEPSQLMTVANDLQAGDELRMTVDGFDDLGDPLQFVAILTLAEGETAEDRIVNAGLETIEKDGKLVVDFVGFDSSAQKAGFDFDQVITDIKAPRASLPKELMFIPALALLALIVMLQRRRQTKLDAAKAQTA